MSATVRFEPIAALPLRATYAVLEAGDAIPMADPIDYADWGTGPITVQHVLAGDLDTLRGLLATPGRAHYTRVGPRRRGPRRSSFESVGGRDVVIPKLRRVYPRELLAAAAGGALVLAASMLSNALLTFGWPL